MLRGGLRAAPWHAFYTCNISLKRSLLDRAGGFNETLEDSPYDDTELGYRLARDHGLVLHLNYNAGAFHFHPLDSDALRQRLRGRRRLMPLLFRAHPELQKPIRLGFRYRLLNFAARLLSPFEGAISTLIRLLVSLRQRGWEGYPVLGEHPEVRCDFDIPSVQQPEPSVTAPPACQRAAKQDEASP
jgi:GT2 family glycosyltransferase